MNEKKDLNDNSDVDLGDMFRNIGKAKEFCARGINEQIDKERAEKQAAMSNFFFKQEQVGADEDIDAQFDELNTELEKLKSADATSEVDSKQKKGFFSIFFKKRNITANTNSDKQEQDESLKQKNDLSDAKESIPDSSDVKTNDVFAECYVSISVQGYGIQIFVSNGTCLSFFEGTQGLSVESVSEKSFVRLLREILHLEHLKSIIVYCDKTCYQMFLKFIGQKAFEKITNKIYATVDFKILYNAFSTNISRRKNISKLTKTVNGM